jgi:2-polyprenyl-3-methyl-5-hydroxy-6-metoxy-1,4-benzoquinol methylase
VGNAVDCIALASRIDRSGETVIRSEARDRCLVCGGESTALHSDVPDLLLGTPGRWRVVRCRAAGCGLLWLNPRPVAEELGSLYQNYFTHEADVAGREGLRDRVRRAIQQRLLGYPARISGRVRALSALVQLVPWYRASAMRELFWLPATDSGRLLDIGCGNGRPMQRFVAAGWTATGIDFDADAVAAARSAGLDARVGALKEQALPDAHFDVILMSHVIEHLPDPLAELIECRRILKPSGSIVIATPNAHGLGHLAFRRHWLGLDPPRHLQIFTPEALTRLLAMSGFRPVQVRTHAGVAASWMVASQWRREAEALGKLAQLPVPETPIPARWLALARLQSVGVALGAKWGDELVGRYAPVVSADSP